MNHREIEIAGVVNGTEPSTIALPFPFSENDSGPLRVVWDDGRSWRLHLLSRGNEPVELPGKKVLFDKKSIAKAASDSRAVIVVSGSNGGLTSFSHWLARDTKGPRVLAVDLRNAYLRGEDTVQRMEAIAEGLQREVEVLLEKEVDLDGDESVWAKDIQAAVLQSTDPIEVIIEIAKRTDEMANKKDGLRIDALAFRAFEALDDEIAMKFFGRLRAMLEDSCRPLASLGIILLGQSVRLLDPQERRPVSTLRSLSEIYAPTSLEPGEIHEMGRRLSLPDSVDLNEFREWSGGEPLLVHALFRLLVGQEEKAKCKTLKEAVRFLQKEGLPAFGSWSQSLAKQLKRREVAMFVERLLRDDKCRNDANESPALLLELFIENWIRLNQQEDAWEWRSAFRRSLAVEAFTLHNFA